MNIFKALCNGNGSINEENITSFLGYLLNPSEDHDMKDEFIKRFLEKIHLSDDIKYTDSKDYNIFSVSIFDKRACMKYNSFFVFRQYTGEVISIRTS